MTEEDKLLTNISQELDSLRSLITINPLYPKRSAEDILDSVKKKIIVLNNYRHDNKELAPGDWVQVFVETAKPFYAKLKDFVPGEPGFTTLEGVYGTKDNKPIQQTFPLQSCIPVPLETARHLEFANGLNSMKLEEHIHVRSKK